MARHPLPTIDSYPTAVFSYTPPSGAGTGSGDAQAVQAALNNTVQHIRSGVQTSALDVTRWFLQILMLRLAYSNAKPGGQTSQPRTMYMVRNVDSPDRVTVVVEDPAHSAVNVSLLDSTAFDQLLNLALLPVQGGGRAGNDRGNVGAEQGQPMSADGSSANSAQSGRWVPRPTFAQLEGVNMAIPGTGFRIKVGIISARGGASSSSLSVVPNIVIEVESLVADRLPSGGSDLLEEFLSHILPVGSHVRDICGDMTRSDWRSILGGSTTDSAWSLRNTSWSLVRWCKESKLL